MPISKQKFVEQMQSTFHSKGWLLHLRPRLVELREEQIAGLRDANDMFSVKGYQYSLQMLEAILDMEAEVKQLQVDLRENPEAAIDPVVESQPDAEVNS